MNRYYQVYSSPQVLAQQFALKFVEWSIQQLKTKDKLNIALSGGSTPQLWFEQLAEKFADTINWAALHFFWVDERYVPYNHPESNYGIAYKLLFNKINFPNGNLHPIPVTGNIQQDISAYCQDIKQHVPSIDGWPIFDLVVLGMGTDGHTASIFPGQLDLFDLDVPVCESKNPNTGQLRVTITGKVINHAEKIYCLVTGMNKAKILDDVFKNHAGSENYPISYVRKDTVWLIDSEAANILFVK